MRMHRSCQLNCMRRMTSVNSILIATPPAGATPARPDLVAATALPAGCLKKKGTVVVRHWSLALNDSLW